MFEHNQKLVYKNRVVYFQYQKGDYSAVSYNVINEYEIDPEIEYEFLMVKSTALQAVTPTQPMDKIGDMSDATVVVNG